MQLVPVCSEQILYKYHRQKIIEIAFKGSDEHGIYGFIISCWVWETELAFPAFSNIIIKLPGVSISESHPFSCTFHPHQHMHTEASQFETFLLWKKFWARCWVWFFWCKSGIIMPWLNIFEVYEVAGIQIIIKSGYNYPLYGIFYTQ